MVKLETNLGRVSMPQELGHLQLRPKEVLDIYKDGQAYVDSLLIDIGAHILGSGLVLDHDLCFREIPSW